MWKYCLLVSAITVSVYAGSSAEVYAPNPEGYYHYPAPPKAQQFIQPQPRPVQYSQSPAAQTYHNQYQFNSIPTQQQKQQRQQSYQQQQQSQQPFFAQQSNDYNNYYNSASASAPLNAANTFPASVVNTQFASPALENAAFTMALTNQGYKTNGYSAGKNSAALKSGPSSSTSSSSASNSGSASAQLSFSATPASSPNSLNVKLPLPFNITPLNIAPLPLQAGAPYAKLPTAVTSYGTVYPQRRRR